jgi:hypothetical protein
MADPTPTHEHPKENQPAQGQLTFELPPGLDPHYSNLARITHTPAEIVFDFARLLPGDLQARILSRVLMSPVASKLFLRALADNLTRYEATFGEIKIPHGGPSLADLLFKPKPPE